MNMRGEVVVFSVRESVLDLKNAAQLPIHVLVPLLEDVLVFCSSVGLEQWPRTVGRGGMWRNV